MGDEARAAASASSAAYNAHKDGPLTGRGYGSGGGAVRVPSSDARGQRLAGGRVAGGGGMAQASSPRVPLAGVTYVFRAEGFRA